MRTLPTVLLVAMLALGGRAQGDPSTAEGADAQHAKLSVTGTASVTVEPDVGKIYLSITVGKPSVADACGLAAETTDKVITATEASGDGVTVTTTNINVMPNITYGANGEQKTEGFICTQSLLVKVEQSSGKKLDAGISSALQAALTAGGDYLQVSSMETDLSDDLRRSATNQARELAVGDASQTADILAKAAKVTLGNIVSIVDSNVAPPTPVPIASQGNAGAAMDSAQAPTVQTGTTDVYATVNIDYAISQ